MVSKTFHMKSKTKSNGCERQSDDEQTIHGRNREREREREPKKGKYVCKRCKQKR